MENAEFRRKARNFTPKWGSDPSNGGQTLQPPEELDMAMQSYIEQLKADTAEANLRQEEETKSKAQGTDPRVLCDKPLTGQIEDLMNSLSPAQRSRPFTMDELVARLQGRYSARPHPMNVGQALYGR